MNHRSNADYILVSYALAGEVAISYAVGEWARAFPLETIFKAFGSYFVRRRYREPLYHAVLERYVQLITREGVTQGIFVEGASRATESCARPRSACSTTCSASAAMPRIAARLHVVPVAINYDRVLEDRSLLRELDVSAGGRRPSRLTQAWEVGRYCSPTSAGSPRAASSATAARLWWWVRRYRSRPGSPRTPSCSRWTSTSGWRRCRRSATDCWRGSARSCR